jgi:hypothetical protein
MNQTVLVRIRLYILLVLEAISGVYGKCKVATFTSAYGRDTRSFLPIPTLWKHCGGRSHGEKLWFPPLETRHRGRYDAKTRQLL